MIQASAPSTLVLRLDGYRLVVPDGSDSSGYVPIGTKPEWLDCLVLVAGDQTRRSRVDGVLDKKLVFE
ncbi:hypothetical protein BH23PAT2_BH23PAT2_05760 [soil metagenome]